MTISTFEQTAGTDDAHNVGVLEVYDDNHDTMSPSNANDPGEITGWRYPSITVPQGSTINSATWRFYGNKTNVGTCSFDVWGVDVDDSATWTSVANPPKNATKTTESILVSEYAAFTTPQIFDYSITDIIQEIVDRGGWSSGNGMALITNKNASTRDTIWTLQTFDSTYPKGKESHIKIDYTAPSGARRVFITTTG